MVGGILSLTLIMGRARERLWILAGVAASGLLARWSAGLLLLLLLLLLRRK